MSKALLVQNLTYNTGGKCLFESANLAIPLPNKVAIIGANGAGKSTLIKILNGHIESDMGKVNWPGKYHISTLSQEPTFIAQDSVFETIARGLGPKGDPLRVWYKHPEKIDELDQIDGWRLIQEIEALMRSFALDGSKTIDHLSEGQKRKVALAQAVCMSPDVLLLDEPTNHLDIVTIDWLIQWCKNFSGTLIVVSHDRFFINQICHTIVEIDHQMILSWEGNYDQHQQRKAVLLQEMDKQTERMDIKLKEEMRWLQRGVTARRRRNMGRLRALETLKSQRTLITKQHKTVNITKHNEVHASQKLLALKGVSFGYEHLILNKFSLTLSKGDHIGIVGPNGCGKSTLIKLLMQEIKPTEGTVKASDSLKIAYFDQKRDAIDLNKTLRDNVGGGLSHIDINGKKKHIVSYLEDFLFTPERINSPMVHFSGGEKNRAMLAKLFLQQANCYILDEPTNDLDMETIEILEQFLIESKAAIIVVSHDRSFINNMAMKTLFFTSNGFMEYAGGYDDAIHQGGRFPIIDQDTKPTKVETSKKDHRYIKRLEEKISKRETTLMKMKKELEKPEIYQDYQKVSEINKKIKLLETEIATLYDEWSSFES